MMKLKKDPQKFTFRFGNICPRQHLAMNALNQLGRNVAPFIAEAVYVYEMMKQNGGTDVISQHMLIAPTLVQTQLYTDTGKNSNTISLDAQMSEDIDEGLKSIAINTTLRISLHDFCLRQKRCFAPPISFGNYW